MSVKISGFTFIKNGLTLGYPILESVLSIESICDEVVINVGFDDPDCKVDDGTYQYLRDNLKGDKYKFITSWWNPEHKKDGLILSVQTNIALAHCTGTYCQYIQGDECVHEDDLRAILTGADILDKRSDIDGLVFNYLHFFGNVDTYKYTRSLYRREVRLIRRRPEIVSMRDAQGFRFKNGGKFKAILIPARIFHYGWARSESVMKKKIKVFNSLYHSEEKLKENEAREKEFSYERNWGLKKFKGTHPKVMQQWILKNKNPIDLMQLPLTLDWNVPGLFMTDMIELLTGYRIGEFKNYILTK